MNNLLFIFFLEFSGYKNARVGDSGTSLSINRRNTRHFRCWFRVWHCAEENAVMDAVLRAAEVIRRFQSGSVRGAGKHSGMSVACSCTEASGVVAPPAPRLIGRTQLGVSV